MTDEQLAAIVERSRRQAEAMAMTTELLGIHPGGPDVFDEISRDNIALLAEVRRLRLEARKYYLADGSHILLDSPEEVVERRKAAAKTLRGA